MIFETLYLFFLISQLGRHFWPEWSFVYGIKVDYLSPTLFLTDIFWLGMFIKNVGKKRNEFKQKTGMWFALIILLNIIIAKSKFLAIYKWIRVGQVWWTIEYFSKFRKELIKILKWVIPWWIVTEGLLGLAQVILGGSVGGLYYWLGERRFDYMTLGVAKISWFDSQYIRAYGTFSHPNSLAGFTLIGMVLWSYICKKGELNKIWKWTINWIGIIILVLAGSRTGWLIGLGILFVRSKVKLGWKMVGAGLCMMAAAFVLTNMEVVGGWSANSMDLRWQLLKSSMAMFKENWIVGVGLNNFLVNLPDFMHSYWWLQPVHNIFALSLCELGVVGVVVVSWWLIKNINFKKYWWVWVVVIISGMVDHYWLTLPQNIGLLAIVMGLSRRKIN